MALKLGDANQSLLTIDKALALLPNSVLWRVHKAHSLLMLGNCKESKEIISQLTQRTYTDAKIYAEIALILNKLKDYQGSEFYYKQAIILSPKEAQLYFNLASIQRFLGQIESAEASLNKAIELDPTDCEAYLLRSSLRRQTAENNHILEMNAVLAKGIKEPIAKAQICYAIAKEEEDIGQYQQSFKHLEQGADNRRSHMQYDPNNDLQTIHKIIEVFDDDMFSGKNSGYDNDEAIFILGLPRTGSTLVERIITSHDQVYSAGELNNFAIKLMEQCRYLKQPLPRSRTELVELTTQINFADLGYRYIESTRPGTANNKHFIDKLPLNSLYAGLIHLALPKAKIIHVKRHPLDTCYSIYKQLFTNGYPFSYNLVELANYYIAHHQLMEHWYSVMPNTMYSIAYEDVITNLTIEAKNLIAYCQLDWQEDCSLFHLNKTASVTASASQVRQTVYSSSLDKWRCYEEQLAPVKKLLEQAGISCLS